MQVREGEAKNKEETKEKKNKRELLHGSNFSSLHNCHCASSKRYTNSLPFTLIIVAMMAKRHAERDSADVRPRIPQFFSSFKRKGYSRHVYLFLVAFVSLQCSACSFGQVDNMTQLVVASTHDTPLPYHPRTRTCLRRVFR